MTPTPPVHSGEWTDEQIARFWWRGSSVERWVPLVVVVAAAVTVALVVILAGAAWARTEWHSARPSARTEIGAAIGAVAAVALLAATWTLRYRDVSRWACAAVTLVCVHVAIAIAAWVLSYRMRSSEELPLLSSLPAPSIAVGASALLFVAAFVHSRVRRLSGVPTWLRGAVVFALAYVLLLGLWLPITVPSEAADYWHHPTVEARRLLVTVLVPPALVALVVASIATLRPRWFAGFGLFAALLVGIFTIGAMAARDDVSAPAMIVYANYVHVLFAAAWFALASLAVLAWMHARVLRANRVDTARPAPWVQRGIVEAPGDVVGAWHNDGWLAGLRTSLAAFTLRTERAEALHVPDGARLVAPVPAATVGASRDELIPALRAGDEVTVSGFVAPAGDGPYRTGGLPVPGSDGLIVTTRRRRDDSIGRDVVLVLYRPCVLFLLFVMLAALPGIVGNEEPPRLAAWRAR